MHVAGHNRVHVHQDGTRHVHQGAKPKTEHAHQDGSKHNHKTGEHQHADGQVHQHKKKAPSQLGLDQLACRPTEGVKAACCPSCGSAACTCCGATKPAASTPLPSAPVTAEAETAAASSLPKTLATIGASIAFPALGVGILGSRLWSWLKDTL